MVQPYKHPAAVERYYEQLDKQLKFHNLFTQTKERVPEYDEQLYKKLSKLQKPMAELLKAEQALITNKSLTMEQRRQRQININKRRIALIKRALNE